MENDFRLNCSTKSQLQLAVCPENCFEVMSVLKSAGDSSKLKAEADVLSGSFLQDDEGGGLNKHKEESARAVNALTLSQLSKQHQQVSVKL